MIIDIQDTNPSKDYDFLNGKKGKQIIDNDIHGESVYKAAALVPEITGAELELRQPVGQRFIVAQFLDGHLQTSRATSVERALYEVKYNVTSRDEQCPNLEHPEDSSLYFEDLDSVLHIITQPRKVLVHPINMPFPHVKRVTQVQNYHVRSACDTYPSGAVIESYSRDFIQIVGNREFLPESRLRE